MGLIVKIAAGILLAVIVIAALVRIEVRAEVQGIDGTGTGSDVVFADPAEDLPPAMMAVEAEVALQDSEWAHEQDVEIATCYPDGGAVVGEAFDRFRCVIYDSDFNEFERRVYIEVTGPGVVEVVRTE